MLSNKFLSVSGAAPTDPQFNYVTMLLHGDGTNGGQNNTFLDSSANAFSITRNGNTTQGSFSPYGSNWSNYFTTSDYLQFSGPATGTGTWTIEGWFYFTDLGAARTLFSQGTADNTGCWLIWTDADGTIRFYSNSNLAISSAGAVITNSWQHIAVVSNASSLTIYVNGVSKATGSYSGKAFNSSPFQVNQGYGGSTAGNNCYISNARMVVGTAVYTSTFTPPTLPLTAISGTSLLTCQSNRFKDNSANNYSATIGGSPSVQRFSPFAPSAAYSTATIGGSGYFDGSGDYLTWTGTAIGSNSFTVECWYYPTVTSAASNMTLLGTNDMASSNAWLLFIRGGGGFPQISWYSANATVFTGSASVVPNAWNHIAVTGNGSTLTMYLNGVSIGTASSSYNYGYTNFYVAADQFTQCAAGYITNARIVVGSMVYSGNFTPPSAPLTAVTNTKFLLSCTNGAIYDNAMMNDLETVGNAQISTSVKKYGTGSLAFDGSGDGLYRAPNNYTTAFGTGNFTVEAWVYPTVSGLQSIFDCRLSDASSGGFFFGMYTGNTLMLYTAATITSGGTVATNAWSHVALVRNGSTWTLYLNGTSVATYSSSANLTDGNAVIGSSVSVSGSSANYLTGYMDDLRITKGYARYTANFTPPTSALADQ
jgi:hypothetical protein